MRVRVRSILSRFTQRWSTYISGILSLHETPRVQKMRAATEYIKRAIECDTERTKLQLRRQIREVLSVNNAMVTTPHQRLPQVLPNTALHPLRHENSMTSTTSSQQETHEISVIHRQPCRTRTLDKRTLIPAQCKASPKPNIRRCPRCLR